MPVEALRKQWDARAAGAPLHRAMTFEGDDLVLGAGTKLAAVERGPRKADKDPGPVDDARLVAMLSAAYRRPIGAPVLGYIRRALVKQGEGETAVALTHLALTGLPKLAQPMEDARRLFMADGLLKAGVGPRTILKALELDDGPLNQLERRYNPDQPRVPAGNGDESGQWTDGSAAGAASSVVSAGPSRAPPSDRAHSNRGVQIADASSDWARFLNPIGEAEAAQAFNGAAPNDQHQQGVDAAIEAYRARGFVIETTGPTYVMVPGFTTGRYYDFVARDPKTSELIGVEVKTSLYDTIAVDESQVDRDFALLKNGGVYVPKLKGTITLVAYEAFCTGCSVINLRKADLVLKLLAAGIPIRSYSWPGGAPPI